MLDRNSRVTSIVEGLTVKGPDKKYTTLGAAARKKINEEFQKMVYNTYFKGIPLTEIEKILGEFNLVMIQEDGTAWEGWLTGTQGRTRIDVAFVGSKDEDGFHIPIDNTVLALSWYKMEATGKYEINVYLS